MFFCKSGWKGWRRCSIRWVRVSRANVDFLKKYRLADAFDDIKKRWGTIFLKKIKT
jgi:hypothetical protein